jgi:capsular exopolysaccharide synthesis family protein
MERIKQAIDKAKQDGPIRAPMSPRLLPGHPSPASNNEAVEVNYTQTRVVELNPSVLEENRIVAYNKNDPMCISFDILRTQVLRKMEENSWRTLAVISPTPECGKTVTAINLAMSIAHHTSKTAILVDFDLRRPKVATYLGIPKGRSLNEVLSGQAGLSDAMVNPGMHKLVVLPTANPVPKSAEVLASKKVQALLRELRERYEERIVLVDLPPLLATDDALTVLPQIDCALMVVGNGMVSKTELEESLRHLHATNLLGVVLNKADAQQRGYYY